MNDTAYRYEYRAFAPNFGLVEDRLRQWGGQALIRESAEVYLLTAGKPEQNIKLRGGQLDIKDRVTVEQGFEQWRPVGKWGFPLDPAGREALSAALGLDQTIDEKLGSNAEGLIQGLCTAQRDVVRIDLFKRRFGYAIDGCAAEYAEVTINGAALNTVCVESADLAAAQDLCRRLGLDAYPNTGYITALMRVVAL